MFAYCALYPSITPLLGGLALQSCNKYNFWASGAEANNAIICATLLAWQWLFYCLFFHPRDLKTCRELVSQYGIKVINQHDSHGHTPMHWAALGGHTEIIKFFINCGADINRQSKTDYGPFPIHWACVSGHVLAVDLLLQNGASIDVADNKGCTPLIIAAQYGKTMLAGYLIGKGSKVFLTDSEGDTALHWACFKGWYVVFYCMVPYWSYCKHINR